MEKLHKCPACKDTGTVQATGKAGWAGAKCYCPAGGRSGHELLIRDCASVSSGTLGSLSGWNDYTRLDAVQNKFIEWVSRPENANYPNWQKAWDGFMAEAKLLFVRTHKHGVTALGHAQRLEEVADAVVTFDFVLPFNQVVTAQEFGELIGKQHDTANPKTRWMVELIATAGDTDLPLSPASPYYRVMA